MTATQTITRTLGFGAASRLQNKLEALRARMEKKGLEGLFSFASQPLPWRGEAESQVLFSIDFQPERIALKGNFALVGVIDFSLGGSNPLLNCLPGEMIPESMRKHQTCAHCCSERKRKKLIIVRSSEGQLMPVGTSCVRDFLGICPEDLIYLVEEMKICSEADPDSWGPARGPEYFEVGHVCRLATAVTQIFGFAKSGSENPTVGKVRALLAGRPQKGPFEPELDYLRRVENWQRLHDAIMPIAASSACWQQAEEALAWARSAPSSAGNYLGNLRALAGEEACQDQHIGLLASLPQAYNRAILGAIAALEAPKAEPSPSSWVGEVGQKITLQGRLESKKSIATQFGDSILLEFDCSGDRIKVWGSGAFPRGLQEGGTYKFSGTVKSHGEYRGRRETVLIRCKLA